MESDHSPPLLGTHQQLPRHSEPKQCLYQSLFHQALLRPLPPRLPLSLFTRCPRAFAPAVASAWKALVLFLQVLLIHVTSPRFPTSSSIVCSLTHLSPCYFIYFSHLQSLWACRPHEHRSFICLPIPSVWESAGHYKQAFTESEAMFLQPHSTFAMSPEPLTT